MLQCFREFSNYDQDLIEMTMMMYDSNSTLRRAEWGDKKFQMDHQRNRNRANCSKQFLKGDHFISFRSDLFRRSVWLLGRVWLMWDCLARQYNRKNEMRNDKLFSPDRILAGNWFKSFWILSLLNHWISLNYWSSLSKSSLWPFGGSCCFADLHRAAACHARRWSLVVFCAVHGNATVTIFGRGCRAPMGVPASHERADGREQSSRRRETASVGYVVVSDNRSASVQVIWARQQDGTCNSASNASLKRRRPHPMFNNETRTTPPHLLECDHDCPKIQLSHFSHSENSWHEREWHSRTGNSKNESQEGIMKSIVLVVLFYDVLLRRKVNVLFSLCVPPHHRQEWTENNNGHAPPSRLISTQSVK
jgi:hypothetical protein